jgi:hypothetical protein
LLGSSKCLLYKKKGRRSWDGSPFGTATANSWRAEAQPVKIEVLAFSGVVQRLY